jgi:hypothetical protein
MVPGGVVALLRWNLPECWLVVGSANLMHAELITELADYRLIATMVIGVFLVLGLYYVARSSTDESG